MTKSNLHIGSSFASWFEDAGISADAVAAAIKNVPAFQLTHEMHHKAISKSMMAAQAAGKQIKRELI